MVLFFLGIILLPFLINFLQIVTPEKSSTASSQNFHNQNLSVKENIGLWTKTWAAAAAGTIWVSSFLH